MCADGIKYACSSADHTCSWNRFESTPPAQGNAISRARQIVSLVNAAVAPSAEQQCPGARKRIAIAWQCGIVLAVTL